MKLFAHGYKSLLIATQVGEKSSSELACLEIPFGKHQGKLLGSLPDSYLAWLACTDKSEWGKHARKLLSERKSPTTSPRKEAIAASKASASLGSTLGDDALSLEREFIANQLRSCCDFEDGKCIHSRILESEHLRHDKYLANLLVHMYGKCGRVEDARHVFDGIAVKNRFSWRIMLTAYLQNGHVERGRMIFDKIAEPEVVSWNVMIASYGQVGNLNEAKKLFDKMPERSTVSWNAIVAAYAQNGYLQEAKRIFEVMGDRDVISWTTLVSGYAQHGHLDESKNLFHKMPEWDLVAWNAIVAAYGQNGQIEETKRVFALMPGRNVNSWNAMASAYGQLGDIDQVQCLFDKMPQHDQISWNAIVAAYAQNGNLEEAKSTFDRMPEHNVVSWTALVQAYAQHGHLVEAECSFNEMTEQNLVSWNVMLAAYSQNGQGHAAIEHFQRMALQGVKPDEISFTYVLVGCSHIGRIHEGWCHFVSISQDYGMKPAIDHYCCMIDILGRAGQLKDAEELIDTMPFLPNAVAWGILLSACRIYRDVEGAKRAAARIVELDEKNAAMYVLLASILETENDKETLRRLMKDRGPTSTCLETLRLNNAHAGSSSSMSIVVEIQNMVQKLLVPNVWNEDLQRLKDLITS